MEKKVFPLPEVVDELKRTVEAWIHTDHKKHGEKNVKLQQQYTGVATNPYYLVLDPETDRKLGRWGRGKTSGDTFASWLRESLQSRGE